MVTKRLHKRGQGDALRFFDDVSVWQVELYDDTGEQVATSVIANSIRSAVQAKGFAAEEVFVINFSMDS